MTEYIAGEGGRKMKTNCCICGKEIIGFGNNPWPIKDSGYCCDECNSEFVLQARIEMLVRRTDNDK